jgi:hypothetical protein
VVNSASCGLTRETRLTGTVGDKLNLDTHRTTRWFALVSPTKADASTAARNRQWLRVHYHWDLTDALMCGDTVADHLFTHTLLPIGPRHRAGR